ncbi:helix-turn-helix domain-containing protein [Malaciobacter canalis]|uniref:helix-turn-helix domain-containing protein n=1 Tax=Malaciobacter canalis TaxID=1912871 RepID=UPI00384EB37B
MNINFENLEKIEEIYKLLILIKDEKINQFEKKWLTTEELSTYIGYSKESIKKMIKENDLELGKHYFKVSKKNLFDKYAIDNWIMGIDENFSFDSEVIADEILKDIA